MFLLLKEKCNQILYAYAIIKENYIMKPPKLKSRRFIYELIIYGYCIREASLNTFMPSRNFVEVQKVKECVWFIQCEELTIILLLCICIIYAYSHNTCGLRRTWLVLFCCKLWRAWFPRRAVWSLLLRLLLEEKARGEMVICFHKTSILLFSLEGY